MLKHRALALAAVAGLLAAPMALADSNQDLDPYWKWSKIERTSAADIRAQAAQAARTAPEPVRNPGAFSY